MHRLIGLIVIGRFGSGSNFWMWQNRFGFVFISLKKAINPFQIILVPKYNVKIQKRENLFLTFKLKVLLTFLWLQRNCLFACLSLSYKFVFVLIHFPPLFTTVSDCGHETTLCKNMAQKYCQRLLVRKTNP